LARLRPTTDRGFTSAPSAACIWPFDAGDGKGSMESAGARGRSRVHRKPRPSHGESSFSGSRSKRLFDPTPTRDSRSDFSATKARSTPRPPSPAHSLRRLRQGVLLCAVRFERTSLPGGSALEASQIVARRSGAGCSSSAGGDGCCVFCLGGRLRKQPAISEWRMGRIGRGARLPVLAEPC